MPKQDHQHTEGLDTDVYGSQHTDAEPRPVGHDIDTVRLTLAQPTDAPLAFDVLRPFDLYTEHRSELGTFKTTAQHRNLRLSVTDARVTAQGSLAALVGGHNARPFDHGALRPALARLARALGVEVPVFMGARVMRLDVGVNVPIGGPVSEVTSALVSTDSALIQQRGRASTAVAYTHRELYVYDKRAERGRRPVDPSYGDGPLMRVELRYKRDVDRQLGQPVTAGLLCDPAFFEALGHRLLGATEAQPFRRGVRTPEYGDGLRVPSELRRAYAALGVELSGGVEAALASVDAARAGGLLGEGQVANRRASALRTELRALRKGAPNTVARNVADCFRRTVRTAVLLP